MTSESSRWPLLEERRPFATASPSAERRKLPRSTWLLIALSFLCGGLVSAAGFSIGWRHQAQHDTATAAALAAANTRSHRLEGRVRELRNSLGKARAAAAAAAASERALLGAAANVSADASASNTAAASVSSGAGDVTASATRIASELKTLGTYLTSTPAAQLDPGYIASQTGYLERQLTKLQTTSGSLGGSVASLQAALRKLGRSAGALSR